MSRDSDTLNRLMLHLNAIAHDIRVVAPAELREVMQYNTYLAQTLVEALQSRAVDDD